MYFYNQNNYGAYQYNMPNGTKATIKSGGCGLCSTLNAINNMAGKELYTVPQIRDLAQKVGARVNGGTDVKTLLNAICKAHSEFSFKTTSKNAELVEHLKQGGYAILHQGNKYDVFSSQGHYVCAYGIEDSDNIKVMDSCYTTSRYSRIPRNKRIVREILGLGAVVNIEWVGKATIDRSPSYYLISMKQTEKPKPVEKPKKNKPTVKVEDVLTLKTEAICYQDGDAKAYYSVAKLLKINKKLKKHLISTKATDRARYKYGTKVTVKFVKTLKDGTIMVRTPSCWVKVYNGTKDKKYI